MYEFSPAAPLEQGAECPWGGGSLVDVVVPRVAELGMTDRKLLPFPADLGLGRPPFCRDPERRHLLQAELNALYFRLYGLDRDEVEWVLDSFIVLRRYEERDLDEFRTKRLVLDRYDATTAAMQSDDGYTRPLDPPPADDRMRHPS